MSNSIQDKLKDFEVQPPAGLWNRIDAVLDENLTDSGRRLARYEELPPPAVWSRILENLNNKAGGRVIAMPKRKRWQLAAAAAIFFAVMIAGVFYNRPGQADEVPPLVTNDAKPGTSSPLTFPAGDSDAQTVPPNGASNEPIVAALPASGTSRSGRSISSRAGLVFSSLVELDGILPKIAHRSNPIAFAEPVEKYMVYTSDDGNAVRLPKKLYDAMACAPQDLSCKQRIRQLQEKAASAAITCDFGGLLEIVNNLQENQ